MPRTFSIALITSLCFTLAAGAEDKPSPAVKRVLDKAAVAVKKNRQDFDKANETPLSEAKAELQDLAKKMIEDGKEDEATAILKQVKTLEADVMALAGASEVSGGKAGSQKDFVERLAGKWDVPDNEYHTLFYTNGNAETCLDADGKVVAKGRIAIVAPGVAEVLWSSGWRVQYRMASDDAISVSERDPNGRPGKKVLRRME